MRSLGPTSRLNRTGREALWLLLPALVGGLLTFALAGQAGGESERESPVARAVQGAKVLGSHEPLILSGGPERRQPSVRFHGAGFDTWASVRGVASTLLAHPALCTARVRAGFQPDTYEVQRWGRERRAAADTAMALRVRHPLAPNSSRSGLADRPGIVIRPLRGPPARA